MGKNLFDVKPIQKTDFFLSELRMDLIFERSAEVRACSKCFVNTGLELHLRESDKYSTSHF